MKCVSIREKGNIFIVYNSFFHKVGQLCHKYLQNRTIGQVMTYYQSRIFNKLRIRFLTPSKWLDILFKTKFCRVDSYAYGLSLASSHKTVDFCASDVTGSNPSTRFFIQKWCWTLNICYYWRAFYVLMYKKKSLIWKKNKIFPEFQSFPSSSCLKS